MDTAALIEQIKLDGKTGLEQATVAIANVANRDSDAYTKASQHTIHSINRALGHTLSLFLDKHRIEPDDSQYEKIHQLRHSRHCSLDSSQINALFETNTLRNQLEHDTPPSIELWQVQRAASTVHAIVPLLIPEVEWHEMWHNAWLEYERSIGVSKNAESIPHNLPRPEYKEFIGREQEINEIFEAFEHPRHWIISIEGIGGVGKSALAMEIAWRMAEQIKQGISPWEYIIWVSAKQDRLPATATGIERITPGFQVLEDIFDQILLVTGFPEYVEKEVSAKKEAVETILDSVSCLLFIDNFETVEDSSITEFLDELPGESLQPGHKVIITTRHRAGWGKCIRLEGLSNSEARRLVRQTAKEFSVTEQFRDQKILNRVLEETGCIPLALRWVVGQVSLGRSLGGTLAKLSQRTEDIHRFCFDATMTELDDDYLKVLYVLSQLESPADIDTIANIAGYPSDFTDNVLQTLIKYSLVNRTIEKVWDTNLYHLLPLTRTYCVGLTSKWPDYAKEVVKRAKIESKRQLTVAIANGLYKRYGAYNEDERVAVNAADAARDEYKRGNSEKSFEMLEQAKTMAPKLGYVYLIEAQILADEDSLSKARASFAEADKLDPNSLEILRTWGEFELNTAGYEKAAEILERACSIQQTDFTLRLKLAEAVKQTAETARLRQQKMQAKRLYKEALQHAEAALIADASAVRQQRHNVQCYQIMMELYQKQENNAKALEIGKKALTLDPANYTLKVLVDRLEHSIATI